MAQSPAVNDEAGAVPRLRAVEHIAISDIASEELRKIVALWDKWRGSRDMPSRGEINMKELGRHLSKVSLIRVIDGGADYEFRVIGDAHVEVYDGTFRGKRMSDVMAVSRKIGKHLRVPFDMVRVTGRPQAFRGLIGQEFAQAKFSWFSACYLPFGTPETGVDHILNAAIYKPPGA
ncbi:MAG: PAS domain-containing protein [Rhizomicrobium sp.]